jgi:hypothetical protein
VRAHTRTPSATFPHPSLPPADCCSEKALAKESMRGCIGFQWHGLVCGKTKSSSSSSATVITALTPTTWLRECGIPWIVLCDMECMNVCILLARQKPQDKTTIASRARSEPVCQMLASSECHPRAPDARVSVSVLQVCVHRNVSRFQLTQPPKFDCVHQRM